MAETRDHFADVGVVFVHGDWLGTERARSSASGVICQTETSLPFGNDAVVTGRCTVASPDFLTGKPRDAETGLDDFGARYLSSQWGRWMSADWTAGASAVPYATLTNPQSLNLYAYVGNDPVDGMDADGHARYEQPGTDNSAYGTECANYDGTDCGGMSGQDGPSGVGATPASGQQLVTDRKGSYEAGDGFDGEGPEAGSERSDVSAVSFWADPVLHHRGDPGTGHQSRCDGPCKVPSCNMENAGCQLEWRWFLESLHLQRKNPNLVPGTECSKGCHPEPPPLPGPATELSCEQMNLIGGDVTTTGATTALLGLLPSPGSPVLLTFGSIYTAYGAALQSAAGHHFGCKG